MAGRYKYVLVGGVVAGIACGTFVALLLGGRNAKRLTDVEHGVAQVPPPSPEMREAERAEAANEGGKQKLYAGDASGATKLFREAIDRAPQPKYFLNLGASLFQEGKLDESLPALDAVLGEGTTDTLKNKSIAITKQVLWECEHEHIACHPSSRLREAVYPGVFTAKRKDKARVLVDRGQKLWAAKDQPGDALLEFHHAAELIPDPEYLLLAGTVEYMDGPQWWSSALFHLEEVFSNGPRPEEAMQARALISKLIAKCEAYRPKIDPANCRTMSDASRASLARAIPESARFGPATGPTTSSKK